MSGHKKLHRAGAEYGNGVPETSENLHILTRLSTWENIIEVSNAWTLSFYWGKWEKPRETTVTITDLPTYMRNSRGNTHRFVLQYGKSYAPFSLGFALTSLFERAAGSNSSNDWDLGQIYQTMKEKNSHCPYKALNPTSREMYVLLTHLL